MDGGEVLVPLHWPGIETPGVLERYEKDAVRAMSSAMASNGGNYVLIDCGADVGIYTRLLLAATDQVEQLFAFEPNPEAFRILEKNLDGLPVKTELFCAAVGEKAGRGELVCADDDPIPHAMFMQPSNRGSIAIHRLDDLDVPSGLGVALKLDVEGAEYESLLGASELLRSAPHFVVQIEAHRGVAQRVGREPLDGVRLLQQLGAEIDWVACNETQGRTYSDLDLDKPFFDQLPEGNVYDIVVWKR